MATVIKTTFQFKRATAARWQELNLVLAAGEPGYELDTGRLKIGNGETPWNELNYIGGGEGGGLSQAEIVRLIEAYTTDFVDIDELDDAVETAMSKVQIISGGSAKTLY